MPLVTNLRIPNFQASFLKDAAQIAAGPQVAGLFSWESQTAARLDRANFAGLVLGCFEADFRKYIFI